MAKPNHPKVEITILGCGASTGTPVITCRCDTCRSRHPRNKRLRASAWLKTRGKSILIDTATDLRQQALKHKLDRVDAILFTHPHADHTLGLDEVRAYNFIQKATIPAYGNEWTQRELTTKFPYVFDRGPVEGGGVPQLEFHLIDGQAQSLDILGVPITPISLSHGSKECIGYRIDSVAYITDCSYISPESIERLKGLSVLILDCLRFKPHGTHFNMDQSLEMVARLSPKRTFLTHLGHEIEYVKWNKKLPKSISLAYDGLTVTS